MKNRHAVQPGWYFEYANPFYPDNDTTAKVITALSKVPLGADEPKPKRARERSHASRRTSGISRCRTSTGAGVPSTRTADKESPVPGPLRRPQRDDRSQQRGHHLADPRDLRSAHGFDGASRRRQRAIKLSARPAGGGRLVVRPLGRATTSTARDLALWGLDRIGVDVEAPYRRSHSAAPTWIRELPERGRRLGRDGPLSYEDPSCKRLRSEHGVADSPGRCSACSDRPPAFGEDARRLTKLECGAASLPLRFLRDGQGEDGVWDDGVLDGHRLSRRSSTSSTTTTITTFPLQALSLYRKRATAEARDPAHDRPGARRPS